MKKFHQKSLVLLISAALLLTFAVSGTVAYLADSSGPVVNEFQPAYVPPSITEKIEGSTKKDVQVQNTGNVKAYIRAAIVVTWQNADGSAILPAAAGDYELELGSNNGWTREDDGFYYHNPAVEPQAYTGILIAECKPVAGKAPEGYVLHVEILAQAVQAEGWPGGADTAQEAFAEADKGKNN